MSDLTVRLMYRGAVNRLHDAEILSQRIDRESDSDYLLELLAFELLLKALALVHCGHHHRNHNYQKIFESLPEEVRKKIVKEGARLSGSQISPNRVQFLLNVYGKNFVEMRYPFTPYQEMSEVEYLECGNLWLGSGAHTNEADFQYYPNELYGLTMAMKVEVENYIANN